MRAYTQQDLKQRTAELQAIAQTQPILIADGEQKQVLLSYDDYQKMLNNKPFVSLADAFENIPEDIRQALASLDEADLEG